MLYSFTYFLVNKLETFNIKEQKLFLWDRYSPTYPTPSPSGNN